MWGRDRGGGILKDISAIVGVTFGEGSVGLGLCRRV